MQRKDFDDYQIYDSRHWKSTPDDAMMFYLKEKQESYIDAIKKLSESLSANKNLLKEVEKELEPFKEKYPEEFI